VTAIQNKTFSYLVAHALYTSINNIYFLFCSKVVRQFVRLGTGGDFLGSTNKYSGDREGYPFAKQNIFFVAQWEILQDI
jgi:hypothetical protein